jgi:hypothetical protein
MLVLTPECGTRTRSSPDAGHTTRSAGTTADAVQAVHSQRPEVVVLGLLLDGGVEPVLGRCAESHPSV